MLIVSRYRLCLLKESTGRYDRQIPCERPRAALEIAWEALEGMHREALGAILLDSRNRAIGHLLAYLGGIARVTAEPRGILVPALLANAAGVIVFHNHPSGDAAPSAEDVAFTKRIREAGTVLGVAVVDHLILGERPAFTSLRDSQGW